MQIISATLENLPQLAVLFDAYRVFYRKEPDLAAAKTFLKARMEQKESVIFLAKNETDELLGFVQLYPLFSSTRMQRMWLLNDLFVVKTARGKGISKLLIERSKQLARQTGACGVSLETEKSNLIGNQLYPAVNFEVDSKHNYYFWSVK